MIETRLRDAVQPGSAITRILKDDGTFPNNGKLPLIVYQGILVSPRNNPAAIVEELFDLNGWSGFWRNGGAGCGLRGAGCGVRGAGQARKMGR